MTRTRNKVFIFCLSLMMLLNASAQAGAHSSLLPTPYELVASVQVNEWGRFSSAMRKHLNEVVKQCLFRLSVDQNASEAALSYQGEDILCLYREGEQTILDPGGEVAADSALLRSGLDEQLTEYRQWVGIGQAIYQTLLQSDSLFELKETVKKANTEIKNVAVSSFIRTAEVDEETWATLWPTVLDELMRSLKEQGVLDERAARIKEPLEGLQLKGKGTLKYYLDAQEKPFAWQFSGQLFRADADSRKVNLLGGYLPGKGLYISGKVQPTRGKDQWSLSLSAQLGEDLIKADGVYQQTLNKKKTKTSLDLALRLQDEPSIRLSTRSTDEQGKEENWQLTGSLQKADTGYTGKAEIVRKGDVEALDLELNLSLQPSKPLTPPDGTLKAQAGSAEINKTLAKVVVRLLQGIPQEARGVFIHELGGMQRNDGATLPVVRLAIEQEDITEQQKDYIVTEEVDIP